MPVIVTVTTSPVDPTSENAAHEYVEATAEDYGNARDDALAQISDGRRAVAIRAERS